MKKTLTFVCLGFAALTAADSAPRSGIDLSNLDRKVRPQEDFYRYVNGGWLDRNAIPSDAVRVSAASQLAERTREQLKAIVEASGAGSRDADRRKLGQLYASFMDEATVERLGLEPLRADLARIAALQTPRDVSRAIGELGNIGVHTPISNSILNDSRNADAYVQILTPWGLGLPGREYYLGEDATLAHIRGAYLEHATRMLGLAGDPAPSPGAAAVVALETELARAQWTLADASDPVKTDNRYTLRSLRAFAPGLDWPAFFAGNETGGKKEFVVAQPDYLRTVARLVADTPIETWRAYFRLRLLSAYAPYLHHAVADAAFAFESGELRGIPAAAPRWKRGLDLAEESMGECLGRLYVEQYVSPQAKLRLARMIGNFVGAFDEGLNDLAWMSPETRRRAREKLVGMRAKIAFPDRWRDYGSLRIEPGDLVGNVRNARLWEYRRNIGKLGRRVDRDEWYMTPQTPDAYEWAPQNEIVIGAALLHPPFFDPDADDAVNYGAIGGTIGHEMSHAFDNIGSQYDAHGTLLGKPGWFTPQDQLRFDALGRALVAQYSKFEPVPGHRVNGEQTLSENIADVAGAAIAWRAWRRSLGGRPAPVIDGLTGEQRFFMGWAQRRRGNYRERELIRILESDEHSPPEVRAVAPLMNLDAFATAFNIRPGDRMYLPPENRIRIW